MIITAYGVTGTVAATIGATSPDGTVWTARTFPVTAPAGGFTAWTDFVWNGSVVVGLSGCNVYEGSGNNPSLCASSPDGTTWTIRTLPSAQGWTSLAWSSPKSLFCAISGGNSGTSTAAATSADGTTWTARVLPVAANWEDLCWGNTVFVAVAGSFTTSNIAASSLDGTTWTRRTMPYSIGWMAVAYGGSPTPLFVAVAGGINNSYSLYATSPDGTTWTGRTFPIAARFYGDIVWNGSLFVVTSIQNVSGASTLISTSPDGTTWTQRTLPLDIWCNCVTWDPNLNLFFATGQGSNAGAGGTGSIGVISPDGTTWTAVTLPSNQRWNSCGYLGSAAAAPKKGATLQMMGVG